MKLRRALILTALLLAAAGVRGQQWRLCGDAQRGTLYLDLDRLWNYNLYERSRWGAGLLYVHDGQGSRRFSAAGYYGYGVKDRKSKWGVSFDLMRKGARERHLRLTAAYDLTAAGSRRMEEVHLTDFSRNAAFMSLRMSHTERVSVGWSEQVCDILQLNAEGTYSAEQRLYDGDGLLYPDSYYRQGQKTLYSYRELTVGAGWRWGLQAKLLVGSTEESGSCMPMRYLRMLTQYSRTFTLSPVELRLFGQAGWSDGLGHEVPYSRMYDLGGTWGSPLHFEHSLLTARPNEFTANVFTLVSLRLGTARPLWQWWSAFAQVGSYPKPFAGVNAAWGHLWGEDAAGQRLWQGLALQSPRMGIVEPVVGIDGLMRWGLVDWGVAMTWRLVPAGAPYRRSGWRENTTLLVTASLAL